MPDNMFQYVGKYNKQNSATSIKANKEILSLHLEKKKRKKGNMAKNVLFYLSRNT